jgi:hypothetical protein
MYYLYILKIIKHIHVSGFFVKCRIAVSVHTRIRAG